MIDITLREPSNMGHQSKAHCGMIYFSGATTMSFPSVDFNYGCRYIYRSYFTCTGYESRLTYCSNGFNYRTHTYSTTVMESDVEVVCISICMPLSVL